MRRKVIALLNMLLEPFCSHLGPVLDIGCYTGLSALAWYEGTREIQAEVLYFVSIVPANCDLVIFTDHNFGE